MKKRPTELLDLDVDRVDGVDKPATGRSFILFKSERIPVGKSDSLWDRLHSSDLDVAAGASFELDKDAKSMNIAPSALYEKLAVYKAEQEKQTMAKSVDGRRSKVSFGNIFGSPAPVVKAAYDSGAGGGADADDDDETPSPKKPSTSVGVASHPGPDGGGDASKGAKPRVVATDKADGDADADDDGIDASERGNRGVARDEDDDKVKTKRAAGQYSKVRRGVSFVDKVFSNDSRQYPIEDMPDRQPQDVTDLSNGRDGLGREYGNEVMARIAGGFSKVDQSEASQIPAAGAGPTMEMDARGVPNSGARFMADGTPYIGGQSVDKPGTINPNLGADGAYTREEIGTLNSVMTRLGNGHVLSPADPGIAPAAPARFPDAATSVSKSKRPRGLFRSVIQGPEAGSSDGKS